MPCGEIASMMNTHRDSISCNGSPRSSNDGVFLRSVQRIAATYAEYPRNLAEVDFWRNAWQDLVGRLGSVGGVAADRVCLESTSTWRHVQVIHPGKGLLRGTDGRHRGTSLTRTRLSLEPHDRPMPRTICQSLGGRRFLVGEVPLYTHDSSAHLIGDYSAW